jgi:hypothetical protein
MFKLELKKKTECSQTRDWMQPVPGLNILLAIPPTPSRGDTVHSATPFSLKQLQRMNALLSQGVAKMRNNRDNFEHPLY